MKPRTTLSFILLFLTILLAYRLDVLLRMFRISLMSDLVDPNMQLNSFEFNRVMRMLEYKDDIWLFLLLILFGLIINILFDYKKPIMNFISKYTR